MNLSRIDRKYGYVTLTAKDEDGATIAVSGVQVAVLQPNVEPDEDTTWSPATSANGKWRVLFAGPDADPEGALVVAEAGADIYARVVDNSEVLSKKVGRIWVD